MCEQAARSCRAGVQRLLRKPPPALRGLDGLLRWVVARMSDKGVAERELLTPGTATAQRKGTSVILDVSGPRGAGPGVHPGARTPKERAARRLLPLPGSCAARDRGYSSGPAPPPDRLGTGCTLGHVTLNWVGMRLQPGTWIPLRGSRVGVGV